MEANLFIWVKAEESAQNVAILLETLNKATKRHQGIGKEVTLGMA